ncbi:MAG: hypothetical protein ACRDN9_19895 [Streptosporangiaceae bacterium]
MRRVGPSLAGPAPRPAAHQRAGGQLLAFVLRHWLFLLVFALGAELRAVVQLAYVPAILFYDSYSYLARAFEPRPGAHWPVGYSILLLRPVLSFHNIALIPLVQHLIGLGMAVAIYALLVHRRVRPWLSALAATPVLLDAYMLQIEQNVMSDTLCVGLVLGALLLLSWRTPPHAVVAGLAGLLLGLAGTVRFVGLFLLIVPLVYVLVVDRRWRRLAGGTALVVGVALPLLTYSAWTYTETGQFRPGTSHNSSAVLYTRTAPLADCAKFVEEDVPPYMLGLCPDAPRGERPAYPGYYAQSWHHGPAFTTDYPPGVQRFEAQRQFAIQVILHQPLDVAGAVLGDFTHVFSRRRWQPPDAWKLKNWHFESEVKTYDPKHNPWLAVDEYGGPQPRVDRSAAAWLRDYQTWGYTRGPVFAAGILVPLIAAALYWRTRVSGLLAPALLIAGTCTVLLLTADSFSFSWRYQLPAIALLPWSGALGLVALFPKALRVRRDGRPAARHEHGT